MAELIVYPDADIESTSVDGDVYQYYPPNPGVGWATLISAPGNGFRDSVDNIYVYIGADTVTDKWDQLWRAILLFDSSELPDSCTIITAILSLYGYSKGNSGAWLPTINIYSSAPASETGLEAGDFDSLGSTPLCDTPLTYAGMSTGIYNNLTLNAAGLSAISKTGKTKLGLRDATYDVAASAPTWGYLHRSWMQFYSAEKGGDYRPKLTITYSIPAYSQAQIIG